MKPVQDSIRREQQAKVMGDLERTGALNRDFLLLVVFSCVIATFGLVTNSAAVIIGAMLIAPLMSPILRCALALVRGDVTTVGHAVGTLLIGVLIAISLSAILGLLVSTGRLNFLEELPTEILNRTRPNLFDLVVALAGGLAGAYAMSQPHLSATLPGVAIATSLMPPLCTVGIGLSQQRLDVSGGALLLFLANLISILFAGSLTFVVVGFHSGLRLTRQTVIPRALILEGILLLLAAAVLVWLTIGIVTEVQENRIIRSTLIAELATSGDSTLVSFERRPQLDHLEILVTIRSRYSLTYQEANDIQRQVATRLQKPIALRFLIVPVTSLDPLVPPTFTPTPQPNATSTATPTATATATFVPTLTPTQVPTWTPTSTSTPAPTPTNTATATPVPTPTWTPTSTPTPTATPIAYARIGATDGRGANVRRYPGRTQAPIAALRDSTLVQLTGRHYTVDNQDWAEVLMVDGRTGWVVESYLVPYQAFRQP